MISLRILLEKLKKTKRKVVLMLLTTEKWHSIASSSFTDLTNIKKTDIKGFSLTYTSQIPGLPRITVQWDAAMQEIADRYPSNSEYLFLFIKSSDMQIADSEVKSVRDNVMRALKRIATRCNLSVVPSMGMVKISISELLMA